MYHLSPVVPFPRLLATPCRKVSDLKDYNDHWDTQAQLALEGLTPSTIGFRGLLLPLEPFDLNRYEEYDEYAKAYFSGYGDLIGTAFKSGGMYPIWSINLRPSARVCPADPCPQRLGLLEQMPVYLDQLPGLVLVSVCTVAYMIKGVTYSKWQLEYTSVISLRAKEAARLHPAIRWENRA